jgi:hypothetical protein
MCTTTTHYIALDCTPRTGAVVSSSVVDAATGCELIMISMDPERPVNRTVDRIGIHVSGTAAYDDAQQLEQDYDQVRT